jgi:phospholipid/cholesterol/gamma-HCH transport system substrate-binding protein
MDHRVPKIGLLISLVCAVLATLTFIYLNEAFRGPSPTSAISDRYHLLATFEDTEVLQTKFNVVVRGLIVGKVDEVTYDKHAGNATVDFAVDRDKVRVYRDASARIGEFSLLGDPYVDLDPGTRTAGPAPSGHRIDAKPSVNFDQALSFLDGKGQGHVRNLLDELTAATRVRNGGGKLNATNGAIARIVTRLRGLTDALKGQEGDIAALVRDSSTVLGELGRREGSIRSIVGSGRATLDALAADTRSVEEGIAQVPGLLRSGTRALDLTRPLLVEARPLVVELERVAPGLADVLSDVPGIAADLVDTGAGLSNIPTLPRILELQNALAPLLPKLEAAVRNLVATLQYGAPRARALASFFSNFAAATQRGDSDGSWARIFFDFEPGEFLDEPTPANCDAPVPTTGVCHNAYPEPGDALANKPYKRGSYPRLMPYDPPPAR